MYSCCIYIDTCGVCVCVRARGCVCACMCVCVHVCLCVCVCVVSIIVLVNTLPDVYNAFCVFTKFNLEKYIISLHYGALRRNTSRDAVHIHTLRSILRNGYCFFIL